MYRREKKEGQHPYGGFNRIRFEGSELRLVPSQLP